LLTVCSGLKALGEKTTAWTHLLHDGETGEPVAAAEAVGIAFDLRLRKAVAIPPERRAALQSLLIPGRGCNTSGRILRPLVSCRPAFRLPR